jgi:GTPase involved in cell partitioning and DNA repair
MDSSSSWSSNPRWIHDVFINFRREDTSQSFVSHLIDAFTKAGINTYIDSQSNTGTELGSELLRAIEKSRIAIIVLSKNYTDSSSCLNELQKVMECRTTLRQRAVSVFYDVYPSVVRHQNGSFGKKLRATAKRISRKGKIVSSWRTALTEAANLPCWNVPNYR